MAFIECKIDTSNLAKAQAIFVSYSKHTPAESINKTALFVVKSAQDATERVSIGRIDAELGLEIVPRISNRGKVAAKIFKSGPLGPRPGIGAGKGRFAGVPLSWLIVGARANPSSEYNRKTSGRYRIAGGHPFKGKQVRQFGKIMQDRVNRMVRARHSGTGFFKQSWGAIIFKLFPFVPASYRRGFGSMRGAKTNSALGDVSPAMPGPNPVCVIELKLGMEGRYPALDQQRNQAMHRILGPVLQGAINREYAGKMAEAARRGWLDRASALRALGVEVSL